MRSSSFPNDNNNNGLPTLKKKYNRAQGQLASYSFCDSPELPEKEEKKKRVRIDRFICRAPTPFFYWWEKLMTKCPKGSYHETHGSHQFIPNCFNPFQSPNLWPHTLKPPTSPFEAHTRVCMRTIPPFHTHTHTHTHMTPTRLYQRKQFNRPKLNRHGARRTPCLSATTPPPKCLPPKPLE